MQLPRADVPNPIAPQTWHFRQSIEYSMTNNYAILDIASKRQGRLPLQHVPDGEERHRQGQPRQLDDPSQADRGGCEEAIAEAGAAAARGHRPRGGRGGGGGRGGAPVAIYNSVLHDPKMRDPRGFILPSDQPDFLTATKFVNILIKAGVVVASRDGAVHRRRQEYPAGSYVVKAAQPFRAHLMDMFEPQDHPNDIPYPGGPPRPPYDVTGYNIAYSMGIKFDRILDGVRRSVREDRRRRDAGAAGTVAQAPERRRLSAQPSGERRVRRGQPAAEGERRGRTG